MNINLVQYSQSVSIIYHINEAKHSNKEKASVVGRFHLDIGALSGKNEDAGNTASSTSGFFPGNLILLQPCLFYI